MSKPGVRLDDDVYEWVMDHRTSKENTVSDVVRKLIRQVEGSDSL